MAEYIEREALINKFSGGDLVKSLSESIADERFIEALRNAPTADVVEVKHGQWVFNRHQAPNEKSYFCSLCAEGESDYGRDNFCPNCGAKMDLKEGVEE